MADKSLDASRPPRVFISYTHESEAHKKWTLRLATDLRANGIDAVLDQWDCQLGTNLPIFMERGVRDSDRVLLVCTPIYAKKANEGDGGVGYERLVVTAAIAQNIKTEKFICVIRTGAASDSLPTFAGGRLYVDFRDDSEYRVRLEDLLRDILGVPVSAKPPIGPNPFTGVSSAVRASDAPATPDSVPRPPIGPNPFGDAIPVERVVVKIVERQLRRRSPETRASITHDFEVGTRHGVITVDLYEDSTVSDVTIRMIKSDPTITGFMDCFGRLLTIALQYGASVDMLVREFEHVTFPPSGATKHEDIPTAKSLVDYVMRWIGMQFIAGYRAANAPRKTL